MVLAWKVKEYFDKKIDDNKEIARQEGREEGRQEERSLVIQADNDRRDGESLADAMDRVRQAQRS